MSSEFHDKIQEYQERRKAEKLRENSEYQKRKGMSRDELQRNAVEKLARGIKEHADKTGQVNVTAEACRRKAIQIAEKGDRERKV